MGRDEEASFATGLRFKIVTRRSLLQRAGLALTAAALPCGLGTAAQDNSPPVGNQALSPVMTKLSTYMTEARNRALPEEVVEKAKQHILDTFAAIVSGSELLPGRAAIRFARDYGGEKIATVIASNILCGPIEAALANGVLAHSDETDDHLGAAVVPAALAVGEQLAIDGTWFLRAVVLGCDISTRVGSALPPEVIFRVQNHRYGGSIAQSFGSAAAAGCAASLNAEQMRWVLDYSTQQASGINAWERDTQHIEKGFVFAGMPARNGVTAALVVRSGWSGVNDIFSGADNFFLAFNPEGDPAVLTEKLGERYDVVQATIKKWPTGTPIQAPLDAVEILRKRHPFEVDEVQQVIVRLAPNKAVIVDNRVIPDINLQYMIAVMMIDKTASFRSAHDYARMQDPAILRQRAKVKLVPDEVLTPLLPKEGAIVEITLGDGAHLSERVEAVRGRAENPMTRDEVIAKASDLMAPVLGTEKCASLIKKVFALENTKNIRELRPLLQRS
jgi:2-methylcitrate dehydratase PrpD